MLLIDKIYSAVTLLIKWAGSIVLAWVLKGWVMALAGRTTDVVAKIFVNVFADLRFAICFAVTGASVVWALVEKRLRHKAIERLSPRVRVQELKSDPERTSSNLTTKGKTNPRDLGGI